MPAPSKISLDQVVACARRQLEASPGALVSMAGVASELGVRPPSLYKHVESGAHLLELVRRSTLGDLASMLDGIDVGDPRARLVAYARAFRDFAHRWPHGKSLALGAWSGSLDFQLVVATATPLVDTCRELAGDNALSLARTLTSWVHGFTEMENNGAFALNEDPDIAFEFGLSQIVPDSLAST